jgi:hypothetical protein
VVLSVLQHATMLLVTIGYHIAGAESMAYIAGQVCKVSIAAHSHHACILLSFSIRQRHRHPLGDGRWF